MPLILFSAGVGGAWIGKLTALAPYQPIFIVITIALLGYGFHGVYREPRTVCVPGAACSRPLSERLVKTVMWLAAVLVAAAIAFPYLAPSLLGV